MINRRKAIGGILGLTGLGVASLAGFNLFYAPSKVNRGQLEAYGDLLAELVDIIIPATETPGAKQAQVQEYVISFMESCASNKEYYNFLNGLKNLQQTCLSDFNTIFEKCTIAQKTTVLESLEGNFDANSLLFKIDKKIRGRSFFTILKSLTVEGYCTSQLGATELLAYQPVPGKYKAITTIRPGQKAWATS
jgi:hypothetical protein